MEDADAAMKNYDMRMKRYAFVTFEIRNNPSTASANMQSHDLSP